MMFKLGIITDEISQDFEHALDVIVELGMTHIELRKLWGKSIVKLSEEELRYTKKLIEERGLEIALISPTLLKANLFNEREYNSHLEMFRRAITIAKFFDINLVRIFSFWRIKESEKYWSLMINKLLPLIDEAKSEGIVLALENEYSCIVGTGSEARRVIEEVRSPNLRILWDPGNAYVKGEVPYPNGYNMIKDYIIHVHIKDGIRLEGGKVKWVAVGRGEIDYKGQFEALIKDKYNRVLSLETHYSISGDKERASRESFSSLKEILHELGVV